MRLTIRIVLIMLRSADQALSEVTNEYRKNTKRHIELRAVQTGLRTATRQLAEILDIMIDTGEGDTKL